MGVGLTIFTTIEVNGEPAIRCNVSSWYVEPAYRCYAAVLESRAVGHTHVTYFNITSSRHTLPIVEALEYVRYSKGRFLTAPAVVKIDSDLRIRKVTRTSAVDMGSGIIRE